MKVFIHLLLLFAVLTVKGSSQKLGFDKSAFYNAMATDDIELVNAQLGILKSVSISEREAYEGALLMKKAGLVSKAREKLSLFKAGRTKLEASIKRNTGNIEFYFLRLIIQEHAPKAVNYRHDLENDISAIQSNFKKLSSVVQQAVQDYSKKSKLLNLL